MGTEPDAEVRHRIERIRAALPQPAHHLPRAKGALVHGDHELLELIEHQLAHVADRRFGRRRVRRMRLGMYLFAHGLQV